MNEISINTKNALLKAIAICGSQKKLATPCKVAQQQIPKWLKRGIPANRVLLIEKATNGQVKRHELRPDLYPID